MSAIAILSSGAQAASGQSAAVDVSAFAALRLNLSLQANLGRRPHVRVIVESAPAAAGPYRTNWEQFYTPENWPTANTARVVLSGFESFMRVRWSGAANANTGLNDNDPGFVLGLSGDGKPDVA